MKNYLCAFILILTSLVMSAKNAADIVLPKPLSVDRQEGVSVITKSIYLTGETDLLGQSYDLVKKTLVENFSLSFEKSSKNQILLEKDEKLPPEAYCLSVLKHQIKVKASCASGAFYAFQTLFQLMEAGCTEKGKYMIEHQIVTDQPRFRWRAYMLDEARHFQGKKTVFQLMDAMATMKMNVFHWHLTDDAGWRIEIMKYPKLTEVGSFRKNTQIGGFRSDKTSGKPHSGFYTQEEIREILDYARERQIKVVPEIEMPGHASAAIASYPWLGIQKTPIEVPVRFGKHYCAFDVLDPEVITFLHDVLNEVMELFDTDVIHIGGDEVRFDQWENDPEMVAYKKKKGYNSFMDLQIEFTNGISHYVESNGAAIMGWSEILGKNLHADDNIQFSEPTTKIADNVIVQFWKGNVNELSKAARDGYRLVNSHNVSTYLDYAHDFITLKKAYQFDPVPEGLPDEYKENIIGSGCQMWTEWTTVPEEVYLKTFPRIAAYAEVGWSAVDNKDYDDFVRRLKPIVKKWQEQGIDVYLYEELKSSSSPCFKR